MASVGEQAAGQFVKLLELLSYCVHTLELPEDLTAAHVRRQANSR